MESWTIPINRSDVLRYVGWFHDTLPPKMDKLVDRCISETAALCVPRWRFTRVSVQKTPEGMLLGNELLLTGNDARQLLDGCESAYLLGATIGVRVESVIRQKMLTAPDEGVLFDAAASSAVEAVADRAEAAIREQEPQPLTVRFSPGYGDLPITVQPTLLKLLDAPRKLGLSLTDSLLLTPTKSITAILGVGAAVHTMHTGCSICRLRESCSLRASGRSCGNPKTTEF